MNSPKNPRLDLNQWKGLNLQRVRVFWGPQNNHFLRGFRMLTLPETNMAHENPHLSW